MWAGLRLIAMRAAECAFLRCWTKAMRDASRRGIRACSFDCSPYLLRTYSALGAVNASRHHRVCAKSACEILLISSDVLRTLMRNTPEIAAILLRNMAATLATRLQLISQRLAPALAA